jgi:alpha-tubulin suppressor-like RCC1 family protein
MSLDSVTIVPGTQLYSLGAVALDSGGKPLSDYPTVWRSTDTTRATVDSTGLVVGRAVGSVAIIATAGGHSDTTYIRIITVDFSQISVGSYHACGITVQRAVFCWGAGGGVGRIGLRDSALIATGPVAVQGVPLLTSISAGWEHTCGVTAAGIAYCWGSNKVGALGIGSIDGVSHGPAVVAGGMTFASIDAGPSNTCGVITSGAAYCWGYNWGGANGHGNQGTLDPAPVPVTGGLSFLSVSTGLNHTCGVASDSTAYCWGEVGVGQLGVYPLPTSCVHPNGEAYCPTPTAVTAGSHFKSVEAGQEFACGLTGAGTPYCWGANQSGQLGDGSQTHSFAPVPVSGGLTFASLATGGAQTCGLTPSGQAYCWGDGTFGQLGNGFAVSSTTPVAASGNLTLALISAGAGSNCAVTTGSVGYCWGGNSYGDLGIGAYLTVQIVTTPARIVGQP